MADGAFDVVVLGGGNAALCAALSAAEQGATHLSILSDPHAVPFYEKLGARRCGEAPSGVVSNRMLPLFEFAIPEPCCPAAPVR